MDRKRRLSARFPIDRQRVWLENLERQIERQRDLYGQNQVDSNSYEAAVNELALTRGPRH
jgi:hypothetical protein